MIKLTPMLSHTPPVHTRAALWWLALTLPVAALAADPLVLSSAQIEAAGIRTQKATPSTNAGSGLVLQGTVQLPSQASDVVSAPVAGVVQSVLVSPGQNVKAGTPVARLLSPQLVEWQREWLQAGTQLQLAQEKLKRDEQLYAEGIIAELRLIETRAQHRMAQVTLDEKRQALQLAGVSAAQMQQGTLNAGLALVAPAAGTVLELDAAPGQRLDAGMPVARLARSGRLAIELQASQEQLSQLKVGDALRIDGCKTPARLTAITPQVSTATQATVLRADFTSTENCLRVHQFVQAHPVGTAGASAGLSLPAEAVVQQAGRPHVFVRTTAGFVPTPVTLGPTGGRTVQVLSGLKPEADVVVQGTAALKGAWQGLGTEAAPAAPTTAPAAGKGK